MTAAMPERRLPLANHYEWLTDYLVARGMTGAVRLMMSTISGSLAICVLALLVGLGGPREGLSVVMMWLAFAGGVVGVALWAFRWPSRGQSLTFGLVTSMSAALACLGYPDGQGALTGCIVFAITGAYFAFLHSTSMVLYNFVLATTVAVVAAMRVVGTGYVALALVGLFIVVQVNMAMPLAISVMVRALGVDLERADRDPLTGLLNRRSFQKHVEKLFVEDGAVGGGHLVVAMVDVDDFKRVNDTRGHDAGDDALVAVGRALGHAVRDTPAVVARSGGEEFVVAAATVGDDPAALARRLCEAISELPIGITASVGTACSPVRGGHLDRLAVGAILQRLVSTADKAMYEAKRAGGNRCHHADLECH